MVQGLCASHCATTCHVCTSFQYVDGEMLSTSFLCWFSMYFLHFSMNYHFKKKWNPAFAIILKKTVCNLAKFCRVLYEITCTYTYWFGVVIHLTSNFKLNYFFVRIGVVQFGQNHKSPVLLVTKIIFKAKVNCIKYMYVHVFAYVYLGLFKIWVSGWAFQSLLFFHSHAFLPGPACQVFSGSCYENVLAL